KDYEYNLKRKMRENKLDFSGTGGGSNKQKTFSDNEKATMAILELNEAVSGNSLARDFGGPSRKPSEPKDAITEEIDAVEAVIEEIFAEDANLDDDSPAFHPIAEDEAPPLPKKGDTKLNNSQTIHQNTEEYAPPLKKKKNTRNAMLEQHVNMQGDVVGILKEKLASMENTQIAILKELQTTNKWHKEADRWRRKAYELKKEKFDEMKKNNIRKNKQYICRASFP
ncbi:uncharacterized protein LOC129906666, partial [Episyrphus balteatus]|uniref:uncharacterized protein LOC129906666 n=1 Tax=Episyrphus balteatus TaxID=286459 RepID=UPI002486C79D